MSIDTLATATSDYDAALTRAAWIDESGAGRIFMRGRDRAALLHRLSTNDIERLRPGQGAQTVLTTPIGRIIDLLTVHALDDALLVVTSAGQGPAVFGHLKKNIFFNDQVTLEPAGRSRGQLALFGPAAPDVLARLAGADGAALAGLPLYHTLELTIGGARALVARRAPLGGHGFTLFVPAEQMDAARDALAEEAAALSPEALDTLRVEHGYPAFGRELGTEYIPLETGLWDAISFTKGCYVGQEIIARMESRNRLAKQLRGLRLLTGGPAAGADDGGAASGPLSVVAPAKLTADGKEAGDLTSVARSPRYGPIALAYVRTAHAQPGSIVGVAGSDVQGEVVELPFS